MAPVGVRVKPKKGWQLIHECRWCGARRVNRVAVDTDQPDDLDALLAMPLISGPAR